MPIPNKQNTQITRTRGIGAGIAVQLAKRGANFVASYTSANSRARAEKVVNDVQATGRKAILCQADLTKLPELKKLIDSALQISETGKIEILVHKYAPPPSSIIPLAELTLVSAALGVDANLDQVTEEIYTTHFDTNVKAPIFLTQAVVPHIPQGGRIVFVSSAAARLGVAGQTVYGATKAANESLARVWAKELGQSHGITVNCVNPGPVATGTYVRSVLPCP